MARNKSMTVLFSLIYTIVLLSCFVVQFKASKQRKKDFEDQCFNAGKTSWFNNAIYLWLAISELSKSLLHKKNPWTFSLSRISSICKTLKKLCCLYFYSRQLKQNLLTVFSKVSYKTYLFYWIKLLFFCHLWCYIEDIWKIDWYWERREMIIIHEPSPFLHIFHCSSRLCIRIVLYCITEQNVLHVFFLSLSLSFSISSHLISLSHSLSHINTTPPFKSSLSSWQSHYCIKNVTRKLLILGANTFYASYNILTTSMLFTSIRHFQIWSAEDNHYYFLFLHWFI